MICKKKLKKKNLTFTLESLSVLLNNSVPRAAVPDHQPDSNQKAKDVSGCENFPRQNLKELQFAGQRRKRPDLHPLSTGYNKMVTPQFTKGSFTTLPRNNPHMTFCCLHQTHIKDRLRRFSAAGVTSNPPRIIWCIRRRLI